MTVNLTIPSQDEIFPVAGVEIGIASAGIKKEGNKDLTIFKFSPGTSVAGVFTTNRFRAAPVQISEARLATSQGIRALLINTGNANAGTGADGLERARACCSCLAKSMGVSDEQVLPFSTGVILETLPSEKIIAAIPTALGNLQKNSWFDAAHSIMTTDTAPKIASKQIQLDGRTVTITGISKGAGMIRPNMATMLGFVATDAEISTTLLQKMTRSIADQSFNRITVDGDTSTNDSFLLIATGQSGVLVDHESDKNYAPIYQALLEISLHLAKAIIRDAEGATKFITIHVKQAQDQTEALKVAYAIALSPLVKTAFYASDPNLGRILAAVGYAGIAGLDVQNCRIWLDDILVAEKGGRANSYREEDGKAVMSKSEINVIVSLGRGQASETVYTCDFSHEYVSINADYRS